MSIPHSNGPLVDLQPTYGAVFIGILFSTGLLGVGISQVWQYYNNFPKDPVYLKLIVAYVIIVESMRLAFSAHGVYYYLVLEWGNPVALASLIWTSEITLLLSPLVEIAVRLYFTYRVWIISRHNWLVTPIVFLLAIANLAIGIGNWIIIWQSTQTTGYSMPLLHAFGTAALALAVGADWCISLSLIYFLVRSRTGMSETNSVINHIVFYTINMGLITSLTDIVILVLHLWITRTRNIYDLAIYQVVGNLYANSLLASLNSRIWLRKTALNTPLSDFSTFAVSSRTQNISSTISGSQHLRIGETVYFPNKNSSTTQVEDIVP